MKLNQKQQILNDYLNEGNKLIQTNNRLNPSMTQPRPFSPFPKVYTKNCEPPSPSREHWGRGVNMCEKIVKNVC
jgi:hypothetical protein